MKFQVLLPVLPLVAAVARPEVSAAARIEKRREWVRDLLSSYTSSVIAEATPSAAAATATASGPQGAISTTILAPSVQALPPAPYASSYPADGQLHAPQPAPYTPAGGVDTNGSAPIFVPQSDFDFQSLALGVYQEYIELDLFRYSRQRFTDAEFEDAGITADYRILIDFMGDQEVGHAELLSNILGPAAPVRCNYTYPFTTVREFIDYSQKLTRWGESGVYGFLAHLDSKPAASLLQSSIATEARQQMIFRQFEGLFAQPFYFVPGIPQSWAWTLLAPYISSCPANQTRLIWQNFPALDILNNPNGTFWANESSKAAISTTKATPLSYSEREVFLSWETPGKAVGPDASYLTSSAAGAPAFVVWVGSVNVTYTPLTLINSTYGSTTQPSIPTVGGAPAINETVFIAITDVNLPLTQFNLTMINPHVVAGPALYQAA